MGRLLVVTQQPLGTDLLDLFQRLKQISVQQFGAIGPLIPPNQGILIRFAGWMYRS